MTKRNVAILIFDGVELLDFAGPFEVFSAARASLDSTDKLLNVFTVAETMAPVTCNNPLVVMPKFTLAECPPIDILLVPGGRGTGLGQPPGGAGIPTPAAGAGQAAGGP